MDAGLRDYTRWTESTDGSLTADILFGPTITANPSNGRVSLGDLLMNPDQARLIGVRLIEGAALADSDRAIRKAY